MKDTTQNLNE